MTRGEPVRLIWSEAVLMALRSTDGGGRDLLGCGLPRRWVLFLRTPPGPAKRLGAGLDEPLLLVPFSSSCSCRASSSSRISCSCAVSFLGFANFCWICFVTRIMSPSRRPSERIVDSVVSGRIASSILSRSKEAAYRVQSSMSQPAFRKNSNQSVCGFFGCADVVARRTTSFCLSASG